MLALDQLHQEDSQPLDRKAVIGMVCHLHAELGVTLALNDGRIAATPENPPLSEEARVMIRENKEALLAYLTTPPDDTRPCQACGRAGHWTLDWMAIWVCDCYYHPEYRTPPAIDQAHAGQLLQVASMSDYWTGQDSQETVARKRPSEGVMERAKKALDDTIASHQAEVRARAQEVSVTLGRHAESAEAHSELEKAVLRDAVRAEKQAQNVSVTSRGHAESADVPPDESEMQGIGVLTADSLYYWRPGADKMDSQELARAVQHIGDMYTLACQYRLHSLWVCPGNPLCLVYKDQPELFAPEALADRYKINVRHKEKTTYPTSATIYPKSGPRGHRPMLRVLLPDFDSTWLEDLDDQEHSWCFSDVTDPRLFLESLILIFERLGVYLATSPAQTGIDSMQAFTRPGDWLHSEGEIHLPHFEELDVHWKRPLSGEELGLTLHMFDANSKYVASTTGADKGIGTPDHLQEEEAVRAFSEGAMGMWEVTLKEPEHWPVIDGIDTARLPHVDSWTGRRWLTSPGLKSYLAMGYDHQLHQGRIWFNKKGRADIGKRRALREWASHLFKVRQELKAEYGKDHPAYKLIKMIANRALGWLDLTKVRERIAKGCEVKDVPWYYAPYYYQEIKGLSRFRMVLKMQELARAGVFPVLVFTDSFGLLSPEPDARKAFPNMLQRENELGGFKHAGSLLVTPDVIDAFSQERPASDTLHLLKLIEQREVA